VPLGMVGPAAAARLALVFPGQGSQVVGMGRAIHDASPEARSVFQRADQALGISLSRLCFEGPEERLRLTENTQPALLTTSVALLAALRARLPSGGLDKLIVAAAGHSLGEYSALVAAGAIDLEGAVRLVRLRGRYMQEAVPDGKGAMAALIGASADQVAALCREAAGGEVLAPANLNAPDQTVIAGAAAAVERLAAMARDHGVRKVVRLPVSAPFHCELMAPASRRLAADLEKVEFSDGAFPVVANVDAEPLRDADALRASLARQVTAPVRWVDTVRRLRALGANVQIEIGPGRVLSGLARRIDAEWTILNVEDPASLEATAQALAGSA